MIGWALSWIMWFAWRVVVTLGAMFTLQHIIHEEDNVWIETKPLLVGTVLIVLIIRIWSMASAKECKCAHTIPPSTGSSGFSGPAS